MHPFLMEPMISSLVSFIDQYETTFLFLLGLGPVRSNPL